MRFAYLIVAYLLVPVYAGYWFFRGLTNRAYLDRFGQRFGRGYPYLPAGCIWVHAVSVGEVQAAVPLAAGKIPESPRPGHDRDSDGRCPGEAPFR